MKKKEATTNESEFAAPLQRRKVQLNPSETSGQETLALLSLSLKCN